MPRTLFIVFGLIVLGLLIYLQVPLAPSAIRGNISIDRFIMAQDGDAGAQFDVGEAYWQSANDPINAVEWYKKSAAQNNAKAAYKLATIYESTDIASIPQDMDKSFSYYKQAASMGNALAYRRIGEMYFEGEVSEEKDPKLALAYMSKAAELGDEQSSSWVADYYMQQLDSLYKANNRQYLNIIRKYSLPAAEKHDVNAQIRLAKLAQQTAHSDNSCEALVWIELASMNAGTENPPTEIRQLKQEIYTPIDKKSLYHCYFEIYKSIHEGKYTKPNPKEEKVWLNKALIDGQKFASAQELEIMRQAVETVNTYTK